MGLDELQHLLLRHARSDMTTPIDGVFVSKIDGLTSPAPSMSGTMLALIAQGAKRLALADTVYEYRAGQYLVASVDMPVTGAWIEASPQRPALGFGLSLDAGIIAELLLSAGADTTSRHDHETPRGITVSDAPSELIDAVTRLLRLLDRPSDIRALAPLITREIVWRLMTGDRGAQVRHLGLADSRLTHVARSVRWIREHYDQAVRVDDLARMSGMSSSAFYQHFHAVTAMSPIQFQKQIRLQEARIALTVHPRDITGLAYRLGYANPSQFSREYRRQFGVSPSQDSVRLRTGEPGIAKPALP